MNYPLGFLFVGVFMLTFALVRNPGPRESMEGRTPQQVRLYDASYNSERVVRLFFLYASSASLITGVVWFAVEQAIRIW